jgi:hypothetical protein
MSAWTCHSDGKAAVEIVPPRLRIPLWKGLGADSEEKREPVSDIDTAVVDSLKALDPEWPIREADMPQRLTRVRHGLRFAACFSVLELFLHKVGCCPNSEASVLICGARCPNLPKRSFTNVLDPSPTIWGMIYEEMGQAPLNWAASHGTCCF